MAKPNKPHQIHTSFPATCIRLGSNHFPGTSLFSGTGCTTPFWEKGAWWNHHSTATRDGHDYLISTYINYIYILINYIYYIYISIHSYPICLNMFNQPDCLICLIFHDYHINNHHFCRLKKC